MCAISAMAIGLRKAVYGCLYLSDAKINTTDSSGYSSSDLVGEQQVLSL